MDSCLESPCHKDANYIPMKENIICKCKEGFEGDGVNVCIKANNQASVAPNLSQHMHQCQKPLASKMMTA
jgi:hypothetical protein